VTARQKRTMQKIVSNKDDETVSRADLLINKNREQMKKD
jgi:hypothetical protein